MLRTFSVAEANALVPWLEERFQIMRGHAGELTALRAGPKPARRPYGGAGTAVSTEGPAAERALELEQLIKGEVEQITELGVEVRRVDGLVDFPSWVDGQLVYLCWTAGEEQVGYWHPISSGFSGRRVLRSPAPMPN